MLYREEVNQAKNYLSKIQNRFNKVYEYHKLDRDACTIEIQIVQKVLKKILDMDVLEEAQKSLFEED